MQLGPSLLPDDDDLELLHQREYETRVYLVDGGHLLVRGVITDNKPPSLFVDGDPEPLEIHRMEVELKVRLEDLVVVDARVGFETHPYETCPVIAESYQQLIGLNVARGFTRSVRELFGGPRGCTHTTALLQAMAPTIHQSLWSVSMKMKSAMDRDPAMDGLDEAELEERRDRALMANLNTCHVWDEDGERVQQVRAGHTDHTPLPVRERLVKLGRSDTEWT